MKIISSKIRKIIQNFIQTSLKFIIKPKKLHIFKQKAQNFNKEFHHIIFNWAAKIVKYPNLLNVK